KITESIDENEDNRIRSKIEDQMQEVDESYFFDEEDGPPKITDGSREQSEEIVEREVVAYVDIGADITNLCIVEDDSVKFVRVIGLGGDDWTEALVEILGTSYDEAEEMKIKVGLPPLTGDRYLDVPGNYLDVADRVFNVLEKEIIRFIGEMRRSFEYYISQSNGSKITKLVFSGGSSSLKNLSSYLEKGLDLSVEWRDPFNNISIPPRLKEQLTATDSISYTIAVGLALRGFEG
ncbi:MAG: pilus assembly protein PilM, partial [Actinobacteria bacterium]|nr:pilus assembly protein PilM [Actinomycetota bacterium]